jgi:hypothetical protein
MTFPSAAPNGVNFARLPAHLPLPHLERPPTPAVAVRTSWRGRANGYVSINAGPQDSCYVAVDISHSAGLASTVAAGRPAHLCRLHARRRLAPVLFSPVWRRRARAAPKFLCVFQRCAVQRPHGVGGVVLIGVLCAADEQQTCMTIGPRTGKRRDTSRPDRDTRAHKSRGWFAKLSRRGRHWERIRPW